jgi:hypothetical protein
VEEIRRGSPEWWYHYAMTRLTDRKKDKIFGDDILREVRRMTSNPLKRLFYLLVGPGITIKEESDG